MPMHHEDTVHRSKARWADDESMMRTAFSWAAVFVTLICAFVVSVTFLIVAATGFLSLWLHINSLRLRGNSIMGTPLADTQKALTIVFWFGAAFCIALLCAFVLEYRYGIPTPLPMLCTGYAVLAGWGAIEVFRLRDEDFDDE